MPKILTKSAKETQSYAKELAKNYTNGGVIALSGELGAGKTTFAQGFAQGLGISDKIISPTFLIIKQYPLPDKSSYFYHIDLYRLENIDLKTSGLEEILSDSSAVVLIEWADKIKENLPENVKKINLNKISQGIHELEIKD